MKLSTLAKNLALVLWGLLMLTGCGPFAQATPQALPTIVLDTSPAPLQTSSPASAGIATASGIIVPATQAQIVFPLAGKVATVEVTVGDLVQAGQVLARLSGDQQLHAALSAAELNVLTAQQALVHLKEVTPQELAQAEVSVEQAQKALDDLLTPSDLALTQLQQEIVAAQDALDQAQKDVDRLKYGRGSAEAVSIANADYLLAQEKVDRLQDDYNNTPGDPATDLGKAQALSNLNSAKRLRDRALAQLNWYSEKPSASDIAEKEANLAVAKARLADAQDKMEKLKNPSTGDIDLARANLQEAQRNLDKLKGDNDPEQMALLQARLKNAQDQADAARASLDSLELKAPFTGTVSQLNFHSGEWVLPGQPVLVLADLDHLRVETTDLSERDVTKIEIGQPVSVLIKALSQSVTGRVSSISPLADALGGDVVYKTTIDLDEFPSGLRAGMSVDVQYGTGE